jgi:hypothetical protein
MGGLRDGVPTANRRKPAIKFVRKIYLKDFRPGILAPPVAAN